MSGKKTCWKKSHKTENKGHGQPAVQFFLVNDTKGTGGINVIKAPTGLIRNDDCCCYCRFYCFIIDVVYDEKDDARNIFELSEKQTTEVLSHI